MEGRVFDGIVIELFFHPAVILKQKHHSER